VPFGLAVLGCEIGFNKAPGLFRSDGPSAHAQNVHVIVLDTLFGGEVIVD
jgi:hypothetical protein